MSGQTIGDRYRLEQPLGGGAMGVVWLADDLELERQVAIKVLAKDADRARFEREAHAAAALRTRTSARSTTTASPTAALHGARVSARRNARRSTRRRPAASRRQRSGSPTSSLPASRMRTDAASSIAT